MKTQNINKIQKRRLEGLVQKSARMDHLVIDLKYLCNTEQRNTKRSKSAMVTIAVFI